MQYNYSLLRKKIKRNFDTQDEFANAIGIGRVTLSQRLNGKSFFSQNEIEKISKLLNISKEDIPKYFFNKKV